MHAHLPQRPGLSLLAALAAALLLGGPGCINVGGSGRRAKPVKVDENAFSGDWKDKLIDVAGGVTLSAEGGALFYAFDSLAYPAKDVDLIAHVRSVKNVKNMKGVQGVGVEFNLADKILGKATTDKDGYAKMSWRPPAAGDYNIFVSITAASEEHEALTKLPAALLLVSARAKGTKFVVIDLDHTVVASGFFYVLAGGARPMSGAAQVIKELQSTYSVIYLTHRPDLMTVKSKTWLKAHKFPRAPLLVSTLRQAIGDSGKFKTGRLKSLRRQFPGVALGIGDKLSDSQAYVANGLKAYLIPHYDRDDAKDCRKMAADIRRLHKDIQVVDSWAQVRAGIFKGKKFPTTTYAARLDARARRLAAEEKNKDDDDDDDDDD